MTRYVNGLNLYNDTVKSVPTPSDWVPLGDASVPGIPFKQATLVTLPFYPLVAIVDVTTSTEAMQPNTLYYVDYTGGTCTLTLPNEVFMFQGSYVEIRGGEANTTGYVINLNAGQTIRYFNHKTTITTGSIVMPGAFDSIKIECDDASGDGFTWTITQVLTSGSIGVL